ncbi:MAG: hypothetical protein LBM16_02405, partial [Clostridiales bacterium]|nr:hypothetical protein [Clostridiales bacterium]
YLDGRPISTCSEATGAEIDKQILSIISECHTNAKRLLTENKEKMEEISEYLFQTETITGEQFMEILKGENTENEDAELAQE